MFLNLKKKTDKNAKNYIFLNFTSKSYCVTEKLTVRNLNHIVQNMYNSFIYLKYSTT